MPHKPQSTFNMHNRDLIDRVIDFMAWQGYVNFQTNNENQGVGLPGFCRVSNDHVMTYAEAYSEYQQAVNEKRIAVKKSKPMRLKAS